MASPRGIPSASGRPVDWRLQEQRLQLGRNGGIALTSSEVIRSRLPKGLRLRFASGAGSLACHLPDVVEEPVADVGREGP